MGSVIEILALLALAHQAQGDISLALVSLERALSLAEPEGYVRIFVDEGEPMRLLIADFRLQIEKRKPDQKMISYLQQLLTAFTQPMTRPQSAVSNQPSAMVEPLSERELKCSNTSPPGSRTARSPIGCTSRCTRSRPMRAASTTNSMPTAGRRPLLKPGNWASCLSPDRSFLQPFIY